MGNLPVSSLVRQEHGWVVFVVDKCARARQISVRIGAMNDREAVVLGGLAAGQKVIVHPGDRIAEGVRVRSRP